MFWFIMLMAVLIAMAFLPVFEAKLAETMMKELNESEVWYEIGDEKVVIYYE